MLEIPLIPELKPQEEAKVKKRKIIMIKVPLITMDSPKKSWNFIENFKGIIDFESYNDKVLDSSVSKWLYFLNM